MRKHLFGIVILFLCGLLSHAQEWTLRLSSNVEFRTWKLTTRADKEEGPLGGANIVLTKGSTVISQTKSDYNGDFTVMVPANAEFILTVSHPGCNTKKFLIITTGVPDNIAKDRFLPSFSIGGFVMAKPFPGIDYTGLQQTLVKVVYEPRIKNFDDDEPYTDAGLNIVGKIRDAENILIEKFCSTNRAGDVALAKPDCPLAKKLYNEAIALIPGEQYPVIQLAKVGDCLKAKEEAEKKAAAKEESEKLAAEKKLSEKANSEKAAAEKAEADRLAKEKTLADKAEADKSAKEKLAADKLAKEKSMAEKAEADKLAKEKALANKSQVKEKEKPKPEPEKEKVVKRTYDDENKTKSKSPPPNERDEKKFAYETNHKRDEGELDKGNSLHHMPQVLGANKYKLAITKADGFFKTKRYEEAKIAYLEALKEKLNDVYATGKLAETELKLSGK